MVFSQQKTLQTRWLLGKFCFKKVSAGDRIQFTVSVFRSQVASGLVSTLMGDIEGYRPGSHKKPPWKKVNYFHIFLLRKLHGVVQIVAKNKAQFKWDFIFLLKGKGNTLWDLVLKCATYSFCITGFLLNSCSSWILYLDDAIFAVKPEAN